MKNEIEKIDKILADWVIKKESAKGGLKRFTGREFNIDFETPTESQIKEMLGRKWRVVVDNLLTLSSYIDTFHATDETTAREFYLSTIEKGILRRFNTHQNASKIIEKAVKVGMLQATKKGFSFNNIDAAPKAFIYNPLIRFLLPNSCNNKAIANRCNNEEEGREEFLYSEKNRDFSSKMPFKMVENEENKSFSTLEKPFNNSPRNWTFKSGDFGIVKATDEEILQGLNKSYPWLVEYQRKVERINRDFPDLFKIRFQPKIERGEKGNISKIGIRAYSEFCNTPSGKVREEILNRAGFQEIYSHDVKSSIFRLTYLLNFGAWLPNRIDFYEAMKPKDCGMPRNAYKLLAQRLYFCSSPERVFYSLAPYGWKSTIGERTENLIKLRIKTYWEAMRSIIGKSYRSEIFFHESNLYIDLLEELIYKGYRVAQVYDAIYSTESGIDAACNEVLPILAKGYLNTTKYKTGLEPLKMEKMKMKIEEEEQKESPENYTKGEAGILALEEDFYPRAEEEHRKAVAEYMKMINEAKIKALRGLASRLLKKLK